LNAFIPAVSFLAVLGIVFGLGLAVAARKLAVKADPRIDEVEALLPGANCGACGHPGCRGMAEAIVNGSAPVHGCPVNKDTTPIAKVMGVKVETSSSHLVAKVRCGGGKVEAKERFEYIGVNDCVAAQNIVGGPKVCEFGCLGEGTCAAACPFGAITMSENGLPVINEEKCTACGICVQSCPRQLITLLPAGDPVTVLCMNKNKGPEVRKACKVGCIGCGICAKQCPQKAITVTDFLASIDPQLCTGCGICISKCPTKAIRGKVDETLAQEGVK